MGWWAGGLTETEAGPIGLFNLRVPESAGDPWPATARLQGVCHDRFAGAVLLCLQEHEVKRVRPSQSFRLMKVPEGPARGTPCTSLRHKASPSLLEGQFSREPCVIPRGLGKHWLSDGSRPGRQFRKTCSCVALRVNNAGTEDSCNKS